MSSRQKKEIIVTFLSQNHLRRDWYIDFDGREFTGFLEGLVLDMKKLGIKIIRTDNRDSLININSYADLLNSVKISSSDDGHVNHCIGHIIGKSEHLDIKEDIRAAIMKLSFAPETVAPSTEFMRVCHNCGCGC